MTHIVILNLSKGDVKEGFDRLSLTCILTKYN